MALSGATATTGGSGEPTLIAASLSAVALAAVHLFGNRLSAVTIISRSRLHSIAGGVSIAYVFLHLLPEITSAAGNIQARTSVVRFVDAHAYVLALGGFVVYYGLEWHVRRVSPDSDGQTPTSIFWLHVGSFAAYNTLIGYLVVHGDTTTSLELLLFVVALGLHLLVVDAGLRRHHSEQYRDTARWLLGIAVLLGTAVGLLTPIAEITIGALVAFLGGGIILNVVKEEIPEEKDSRYPSFVAGTAGYALLLLAL